MSPEQARGKPVDKRTDIWSFGCVLFECLTGTCLFRGEEVTETLAKIIEREPDWSALPENTPPTIRLLLRKCLTKDRKRRLHDIADARVDLEQGLADPSSSFIRISEQALQSPGKTGNPISRVVLIIAAAALASILTWFLKPDPVAATLPPRKLDVKIGEEATIAVNRQILEISPDGSMVVYRLDLPGADRPQLYLRHLDQLAAKPLPGTLGGSHFCFSPDGSSVVFRISDDRILKRVSIAGGLPLELGSARVRTTGIDWTFEDWIVFGEINDGLYRLPSGGGTPEPLTTLAEGETSHKQPQVLPGARGVLFIAERGSRTDLMVQKLTDGKPDGMPNLLEAGVDVGRYVASGYLFFTREGTLYGVGFDADSLERLGQVVPALNDIIGWDISNDGTLVYLPEGPVERSRSQLEWIDRTGTSTPLPLDPDDYGPLNLSPNGDSLAYVLNDGEQMDLWTFDIERGFYEQLTRDPGDDTAVVWSPNGEGVVFTSMRDGVPNLFWKLIGVGARPSR